MSIASENILEPHEIDERGGTGGFYALDARSGQQLFTFTASNCLAECSGRPAKQLPRFLLLVCRIERMTVFREVRL